MEFLVARAYNSSDKGQPLTSHHIFSIVASKNSVKYVFPDQKKEARWDKRAEQVVKSLGIERPDTPEGWLDVATQNMGVVEFVLLQAEDSIGSLTEAVKNERKSLVDSKEKVQTKSPIYSKVNEMMMREAGKLEELMENDPELEAFLRGDEVGEVPQSYKEYIKFLIEQAGTEDLNPWLEPWLAGDIENMDLSNGLVLYRDMDLIKVDGEKND